MRSGQKVLLYPFLTDRPYFEGYAWAMTLASRMNASLQLFTAIPSGAEPAQSADSIYHSLLEAQGYFLQHYQSEGQSSDVKRETCITEGDLNQALLSHLRKNAIDIVIIDPIVSSPTKNVREIIKETGGVIMLPGEVAPPGGDTAHSQTDHFYDRLRRSKLYKLPDNFFDTLGKDRTLFNYLRKFFQRKLPDPGSEKQ